MDNNNVEPDFSQDPLIDNPNGSPIDSFVGDSPSSGAVFDATTSGVNIPTPSAPTQTPGTIQSDTLDTSQTSNQTLVANSTNDIVVGRSDVKKTKVKVIIIAIAALAILAIAATIIIVVINNNNNTPSTDQESGQEVVPEVEVISKEALEIYNKASDEIGEKILNDENISTDTTGNAVFNLYLEKISATDNSQAKAMLLSDYYQTLMAYQPSMELKDAVLQGLKAVDAVLKTYDSAMTVVYAAEYYNDSEIVEEYNKLAEERLAEGRYGFYDINGDNEE